MLRKPIHEDPGVMSLGLFALGAFLLVGALAAVLGRDAGVDPNPMPFTVADSAGTSDSDSTYGPVRTGLLPAQIGESSGIAHSMRDATLWFTHNDGGDGRVFAVRTDGTLEGTWRLAGVNPVDIEDIASAPCPVDRGAPCLYLADTGDNDRDRDEYTIYVVREPDASASETGTLELVAAQTFDYGGDSRDAEALAVMRDGSVLVITKGQEEGAEMFRLPPMRSQLPGAPGTRESAESLGMLPMSVERRRDRVTGAAVSPSGRVLAGRSDAGYTLFELPDPTAIARCDYEANGQQGDAVDFLDEYTLLMTFASDGGRAPIVRARCAPDDSGATGPSRDSGS
jgi:hypothetical protein